MRIFPRILPPTVSRTLWLLATVVVLVLWHRSIFHWLDHGPVHDGLRHAAEGKLVVTAVVLVVGAGLRGIRRTAAARRGADEP